MTSTTAPLARPSKAIHIAAWVVQGLLALAFGLAGLMKLGSSNADLIAQGMSWVAEGPAFLPKLIGAAELAGALGLILPSALRIKPGLTALAALGLSVVMVLAAIVHVALGELPMIGAPIVLGGLAGFVFWARSKKAPIQAR